MKESIQKLNTAVEELERAQTKLEELKRSRSILDFNRHNKDASVTICGVSVVITKRDRSYKSCVIRGYEMIHLGMQKAYNGLIDDQAEVVEKIKNEIKNIADHMALGQ